ncbi:MAG: Gfo/Idh/MocA family oxidoreductase [Planctomycetales bacterium]
MTDDKIRIAVVGSGHLGRYHARLAASNDSFQLVAVVDPMEKARQELADELDVQACSDHRQLIGQIDAAVVATPTLNHHQVGMELLLAGIDLLIEKPIAVSLGEANELVDCAAANNLVLQVGHVERFNPALAAVDHQITSPKYIETRRFSGYAFRSMDIGVVLDLMIHDLDIVLHLAGSEPVRIDAVGASVLGPHEDVANARIVFSNGCIANLNASRVSYETVRQMQVWCPQAFFSVDYATATSRIARPSRSALDGSRIESLKSPQIQDAKDNFFQEWVPVEEIKAAATNAIADELEDFASAIRTRRQPRVPGKAGRDALAVCQQILDSIGNHAWDGHADGRIGPNPTRFRGTVPNMPAAPRQRKAG